MSYGFRIEKIDGKLVLDENAQHAAQHLPDGAVISVNGHHPVEGTSQLGTIGVQLGVKREPTADQWTEQKYIVGANAQYNAKADE